MAEAFPKLKVLIVSGSPIIGSFDFKTRVDFIRVPSVIKLRSGDYVPLGKHGSIHQTTALRATLIREAALSFDPDVFIVDKEPLGLRGELEGTLESLKQRGTHLVLGLRDVLDEPQALAAEWDRKNVIPAIENLFDSILVYGLRAVYDPLQGIGLSDEAHRKTRYTGYLKRSRPSTKAACDVPDLRDRILVTTGGGGDGEALIEWVLQAYEKCGSSLPPALMVPGPFMLGEARQSFESRAAQISKLRCITFEPRMEHLMADCSSVVSMGGYNTFCEVLSFDKRALLVPRKAPRLEQTIRAQAAERLGLARWVPEPNEKEPVNLERLIRALHQLPNQPLPSANAPPDMLAGLDKVVAQCAQWLSAAGTRSNR